MRTHRRKTAPKVRNGKVQKKNRYGPTRNCYNVYQPEPVIDRRRPGEGYRHIVSKRQMERFTRIIPDWKQIAVGLDVIVIDSHQDCMGWFRPTFVAICAWEREIVWENCSDNFVVCDFASIGERDSQSNQRSSHSPLVSWLYLREDHREIFDKLGVAYRRAHPR